MKLKDTKGHGELHANALNDILFILLFFFLIVSTLANPNIVNGE
jgi:biopolymer transport protein ExbD